MSCSIARIGAVTCAALSFAATAATQQTVVAPSEWTDSDAPSSNAFPFGSSAVPYRYLNVHDDMAGTPRALQSLALRRSGTTSTTVIPGFSVTLDLFLSTAVVTGSTVVAQFDANHGADLAQVTTNRTVNFPPMGTGLLPYPFAYVVPFDTPFLFAAQGPLCWEVRITARQNQPSGLFHDYVSRTSTNPSMVVSRYGDGCTATGRTDPFGLTGASSNSWSNGTVTMTATAQDGPAGAPAVWLVGLDPTQWNGIPLPIQIPSTAGGTSGPCFLNAPGLALAPGTLNSSGDFTFRLTSAATPALNGLKLYSQVAAVDQPANSLGLVTTNGLNHQVLAPYSNPPGGRVYESGSLGTTGTLGANQTLVVQFTY